MGAAEALGGPLQDRLGYAFGVGADFAVPKADDGPAFSLQVARARFVAQSVDVLTAVNLHDELGLAAGQVGDVRFNDKLTGKFRAVARENAPQDMFLLGCMDAQVAGSIGEATRNSAAGHLHTVSGHQRDSKSG